MDIRNVLDNFIPEETAQASDEATTQMRKILEEVIRRLSRLEEDMA